MTTTTTPATPQIDSVWTDITTGAINTITRHTMTGDKPGVTYTITYPGSDRQGVGNSDVDFFLLTRTAATS